MARNQLQKDIEVALSWFSFIPSYEAYEEDLEVFKRLKQYLEKELGNFDTYTRKGDNKRKTVHPDDIIGIIDIPPVEGRFHEILSTQEILDTETDIKYYGLVDREFLEHINELVEEKNIY